VAQPASASRTTSETNVGLIGRGIPVVAGVG
jgi:hypothetical protein